MKRNTQQRSTIASVFERATCPLSPRDVLERARADCPGLGLATVYRAIRDLLAAHLIVAVAVTDKPPLYERAGQEHHHHFQCLDCGEVTPLRGCSLNASYKFPEGFKVTSHEVLFSGHCPACDEESGRR